jgi:hypothetical protein
VLARSPPTWEHCQRKQLRTTWGHIACSRGDNFLLLESSPWIHSAVPREETHSLCGDRDQGHTRKLSKDPRASGQGNNHAVSHGRLLRSAMGWALQMPWAPTFHQTEQLSRTSHWDTFFQIIRVCFLIDI